jgi:hypothetical protein
LKGGWKPKPPDKIYLPKPSGLQRPLSLLSLEDQIVYQAIANIFAKRIYNQRKLVERKAVFSNILENDRNSIFFVQDWRKT